MMMECSRQGSSVRSVEDLVVTLCRSLEEQVTCVREGNLSRIEEMSESADAVVAEIVRCGGIVSAATEAQREHLGRLYAELILALTAERSDTEARLRQLRQVKRAVGRYGSTRRT